MSDSDSSSECSFGKSYGSHENSLPYDTCLVSILKDRFLCDLVIRVGDNTRPAHRVILSAASSFFRQLLKDKIPLGHEESESEEVDLTSVFTEAQNLDEILVYIYSGHLTLTEVSVRKLLRVNKVLTMAALDNQCAQFLLTNLRSVNCLQTWETAWNYNLQELLNISLIVCRETLNDLLIINDNIVHLSNEFLSEFIANEEVLDAIKPDSVVRMLLWWTHAQPISPNHKKDRFLSLLDAYLEWKTLSEIEFESISITISRCSEEFPELTDDIGSWLSNRYVKSNEALLQKGDCESSENPNNSNPSQHCQNWSLLVAEKDCRTVGIYCNTKSKWFTMELQDNIFKMLGFIDNHVVFERKSNTLFLKNVSTMTSWTLSSPIYNTRGIEKCAGANETTFFLYLNNIYSVDVITKVDNKDLLCLFNRWDHEEQCWKFMLHLIPEIQCNDVQSISLKVDTSYGDIVYLFLTVKLTPESRNSTRFYPQPQPDGKDPCESSASGSSGKSSTTLGEKPPSVCMKPLEMFYVYQINMKDNTYRQIGKRRCEPAILSTNRKIILEDKILFFLDPDREIESQFRYAFYYKNDCYLNCLSLSFKNGNWANMALRVPLPNIRDVSIKKRDRACFDSFVTACKNLLFVGTHWCPHVFQVIMYDISNLTIGVLPAIPLPAIRHMSIGALHAHQPISNLLTEEIRTVDLLNFHFKDWSLLSWQGILS